MARTPVYIQISAVRAGEITMQAEGSSITSMADFAHGVCPKLKAPRSRSRASVPVAVLRRSWIGPDRAARGGAVVGCGEVLAVVERVRT